MLFEQLRAGGCLSYIAGCEKTCAGVIIDPALDLVDRYVALTVEKGLRVRYVIDSHTHADHFSAARELARQLGARIVMHRRCGRTPGWSSQLAVSTSGRLLPTSSMGPLGSKHSGKQT